MRCSIKRTTMTFLGLITILACGFHPDAQAATEAGMAKSSNQPLQIVNLTNLKVVIQVNSKDTVPSGISEQVMATKHLLAQYQALGMKNGKDYEILMVFRSGGVQFLLNDAAYGSKVVKKPSAGNPNSAILLALHNGGVKMYECHVSMKMKGYIPADLQSYAIIVETGIGALVDFDKSGYLPFTP